MITLCRLELNIKHYFTRSTINEMPTFSVLTLVQRFKVGSSISLIRTEFKAKKKTFFIAFCSVLRVDLSTFSRFIIFWTSRFIIHKNFTERGGEKNLI